jgi:8-oxo-dGTP diphosphatase
VAAAGGRTQGNGIASKKHAAAMKEVLVFGQPIDGIDYRHRPGSYGIVYNSQYQVCIVRTATGYALPGGGIEDGETKEQALLREVSEETGFVVTIQQPIGRAFHYTHSETEGYIKKECFYYSCFFKAIEKEPSEMDHVPEWCSYAEALDKLKEKEQAHYWAVETFFSSRLSEQ